MAVSKRLRFEILRRDNHTCRYCGASAPSVPLTVDHVTPEALGGTDDPTNLVTACVPCNSGKTSIAPGSHLVDDVRSDALRWARALEYAAEIRKLDNDVRDAYAGFFEACWREWTSGPEKKPIPLDSDWRITIDRFYDLQLSEDEIQRAVRVAMANNKVTAGNTFRYFCGVCWAVIRDLQKSAADILMAELADEDY